MKDNYTDKPKLFFGTEKKFRQKNQTKQLKEQTKEYTTNNRKRNYSITLEMLKFMGTEEKKNSLAH